jgi:O-antigen ligase/cytochrome c-type biogenesis protein CcmH/NrfG
VAAGSARSVLLWFPILALPWLGSAWLGDFDILRMPAACAGGALLAGALLWEMRGRPRVALKGAAPAGFLAGYAAWALIWLGAATSFFEAWSRVAMAAVGLLVFSAAARRRREWLAPAMAAAGAGVAVCGLGQALAGSLPVATMENSNYAGTFVAICVPLALALALASLAGSAGGARIAWSAAAIAMAGYVVVSGSRGACIAAALGAIPLILARIPAKALAAIAAAALLAGGALLGAGRGEWLGRWAAVFDPNYRTNRVRLDIWAGTLEMASASPLQGVGPANFDKRFPPHRREGEFAAHHAPNPPSVFVMVENAHNGYLQALAEGGLVGAALLACAIVAALRRRRAVDAEGGDRWTRAGVLGGLIAMAAASMFNSLNVFWSHWIWFWLLAGIWAERFGGERELPRAPIAAGVALAGIVALVGLWLGVENVRAFALMRVARPADPVANADAALRANPWIWKTHWRRAGALAQLGRHVEAVEGYDAALRLQPDHAALLVERGAVLAAAGDLPRAERDFARAAELAPWWWGPPIELAKVRARQRQWSDVEELLSRARRLRPGNPEPYYWLGLAYCEQGRFDDARRALEEGAALGLDWRRRLPEEFRGRIEGR